MLIDKSSLKNAITSTTILADYYGKSGKSHAEVKKFGYRWVYTKDQELSNPLARKRKSGAIEQNEGRNKGKRSKGIISPERRKDAANSSQENTINLLQNEFANVGL